MSTKKVVLVTGTSSGIGLATAIQLCERSYTVIATLRNISKAPSELSRFSNCDIQSLDVTNDSSADALVSYIQQTYGRCDILINNAGLGLNGNIESMDITSAQNVFDVNVWGVMRMCKKIAPLMRAQGGGLILTVSSVAGFIAIPFWDIYNASKHAVEGMLNCYRFSVFKDNIAVAVVNPGPIQSTQFFTKMYSEKDMNGAILKHDRDDSNKKEKTVEDMYQEFMCKRSKAGQSVGECAEAITNIVEQLEKQDVSEGELVEFWHPTSEDYRELIANMKSQLSGSDGIYRKTVNIMKGFNKKAQLSSE